VITISRRAIIPFLVALATVSATLLGPLSAPAQAQGKIRCATSMVKQVDPILEAGNPVSGHLHRFFGSTTIATLAHPESATYAQLAGQGTNCGNPADTAAYWVPELYVKGIPLAPLGFIVYYQAEVAQRNNGKGIEPFPADARIVAGNAMATGPQSTQIVSWACGSSSTVTGQRQAPSPAQADCAHAGGKVHGLSGHVRLPNCWDGVLNNHAVLGNTTDYSGAGGVVNHFTYSVNHVCPAGFPHHLPHVVIEVLYPYTGDGRDVTLSSGGQFSYHADFWNTWNQAGFQTMVTQCINTSRPLPSCNV
jgi:hypothetical protein